VAGGAPVVCFFLPLTIFCHISVRHTADLSCHCQTFGTTVSTAAMTILVEVLVNGEFQLSWANVKGEFLGRKVNVCITLQETVKPFFAGILFLRIKL
jgi:hypothetical protein